ncbi:MAG: FGGY family carbohydrate kinase [Thermomicrobiales bacterium]|nr:FGGY family carbohydrate kinase [Thermomicrobiales bacterium]
MTASVSETIGIGPYCLAIDIGTSSARAILYDATGMAVADRHAQAHYEIDTGLDGRSTFDGDALRLLTEGVIDEACDETGDLPVAAVGVSCFWHSLVGLDDSGTPITPVFYWGDNRSIAQVDRLRAALDQDEWRARSGCVFHSNFWPAKLLWLRETDPETFARVHLWTAPTGLMSRAWLDSDAMSLCMASGTGMVDLESGKWITDFGDLLRIDPATLPPIVDRDEPVRLNEAYAQRWPQLAQAAWYPALGDGACATIGSGSTGQERIAMTLGSSGATRMPVRAPLGSRPPLHDHLWIYRIDRNTALYGAAISNGGLMLDWTLELLDDPEGELRSAAAELAPGAHGLSILPFLSGERSPIWNDRARGVISGLTLATTRADVMRAATEAVAFRLAETCDAVRAIALADAEIIASGPRC